MQCLANPAKLALLLQVLSEGETTAKALAEKNRGIPQATLYRHLKKLVSDGILKVVEERQVRNVTEKIYAMAIDFNADLYKAIKENGGEAYFAMFQQFAIGLLKEFGAYCSRDDIDILSDGSGFRIAPIHATLDELVELSVDINKLIEPYTTREAAPGRETHSIAIIITPPSRG